MTHVRNTDGIRAAARKRCEDAYRDVKKALADMVKDGSPITAAAVARRAGRSTRYVQTHPEFGPKIRKLSRAATATPGHLHQAAPADDHPIAALRTHIRTLQAQHRQEVADLKGQLRQAQRTIESLTAQIITLQEGTRPTEHP